MSITQVAEKAGVSIATVSRLINGKGSVSVEAAKRIRASMRQLGYQPRAVRPGLRQSGRRGLKTGNIMLLSLYPFTPKEMFAMPTWPGTFGALVMQLGDRGAHLLFAHSPDGVAIPPALIAGKVDGVIVVGSAPRLADTLRDLLRLLPVVWALREHNDTERHFDHVFYDNRSVGGLAAEYLFERGHRRVAFFNVNREHSAYRQRREDFCKQAAELGMQIAVFEAPQPLPPSGYLAYARTVIDHLQAAGKQRPTALFAPSDDQVVPVHNLLHLNMGEPFRLELIGCNNDPAQLNQMAPRPATIDIRMDEVARRAIETLFNRIADPISSARIEMRIKPMLVPADSE